MRSLPVLLLLAACAPEPEPETPAGGSGGAGGPVGSWAGTVEVRGADEDDTVVRHYQVYAPERLAEPAPALFVLGGFTVDGYSLPAYTELNRTADLEGFLVVYGQAELRDFGDYDVYAWYVYENAWNGGWRKNPDLAYLSAIRDTLADLYDLDRTRTYVSGHSRGAALSVIAAHERPDLFAGFAAQAGFVGVNAYDERIRSLGRTVTGFLVHGIEDPDVSVESGDELAAVLEEVGGSEGETFAYERMKGVTHEWQPQLNQALWDFLSARPIPVEEAAP